MGFPAHIAKRSATEISSLHRMEGQDARNIQNRGHSKNRQFMGAQEEFQEHEL